MRSNLGPNRTEKGQDHQHHWLHLCTHRSRIMGKSSHDLQIRALEKECTWQESQRCYRMHNQIIINLSPKIHKLHNLSPKFTKYTLSRLLCLARRHEANGMGSKLRRGLYELTTFDLALLLLHLRFERKMEIMNRS